MSATALPARAPSIWRAPRISARWMPVFRRNLLVYRQDAANPYAEAGY
jgi:hypothetical protein